MVRKFNLKNEKGQTYSLMDIYNYCLLTAPAGLGYEYTTEYEQLGNTFVTNIRSMGQGQISGNLNFLQYDNYRKLVNFIESSEKLYLSYIIPYKSGTKEYLKDIQIQSLSKTEIQPNGVMTENIVIDCLSLWYETNIATYTIDGEQDLIRWDFTWDSYFSGYNARDLTINNQGHTEATIEVTINGQVVNPAIQLYVDNVLYQNVVMTTTIDQYEKLLYSSRENDFYIKKELVDGTITNLFDLNVIDFNQDSVVRIPKNKTCRLLLTADNDITSAQVKLYIYYKAV